MRKGNIESKVREIVEQVKEEWTKKAKKAVYYLHLKHNRFIYLFFLSIRLVSTRNQNIEGHVS